MASRSKITIRTLRARKREGQRIAMLTCYDYATARLLEEAEIDSLLVGDTYAEVCLGHPTTLPATMDQMVTIAAAVRRGAPSVFLVGDMPYLSYQTSVEQAIRNAGRFMAEAHCDCIKVEVDRRLIGTVEAMTAATIPVMAHLGLLPQAIARYGGYRVQGKRAPDALRILEDAKMMEEAGAVALLLEAVPSEVAELVTRSVAVPVIGCVSGPRCDGQVVVMHDMLGYGGGHPPRAVKQFARVHDQMVTAFRAYADEVREGLFPRSEDSASMDLTEREELHRVLDKPGKQKATRRASDRQ